MLSCRFCMQHNSKNQKTKAHWLNLYKVERLKFRLKNLATCSSERHKIGTKATASIKINIINTQSHYLKPKENKYSTRKENQNQNWIETS